MPAGAGTIRVLTSSDGAKWESTALIQQKDVDLRDPKLSITPDGRLMMVAAGAVPPSRDPLTDHYSAVLFSKDGKDWTEPKRVLGSFQWLWRLTWHNGTGYGVAYEWDPKAPAGKDHRRSTLVRTKDGIIYEPVAKFKDVNPSEATVRFDGDTAFWLQRRDGTPNTAYFGTSQPPYTDWTWHDLGFYFGGPNFIRLPDRLLVGVWPNPQGEGRDRALPPGCEGRQADARHHAAQRRRQQLRRHGLAR